MEFRDDYDWIDYNPKGFNIHAGPFNIARLSETEFYMYLDIEDHHLNQGGVGSWRRLNDTSPLIHAICG